MSPARARLAREHGAANIWPARVRFVPVEHAPPQSISVRSCSAGAPFARVAAHGGCNGRAHMPPPTHTCRHAPHMVRGPIAPPKPQWQGPRAAHHTRRRTPHTLRGTVAP
eukprot:5989643-Pyramimonas_sp.AAC.1